MLLNFVEVISESNLPYTKMYVNVLRFVRHCNLFNKDDFVMHWYMLYVTFYKHLYVYPQSSVEQLM